MSKGDPDPNLYCQKQKAGQILVVERGMFIALNRILTTLQPSDAVWNVFFRFRIGPAFCEWIAVESISQFFSELWALHGTMVAACVLFFLFLGSGSAVAPAAQVAPVDGRLAYAQTCASCHANGVAGAPRLGVREDWQVRLTQGRIELARSVLKGRGGMPPKGGNASLSDEAALAALEYIVSAAK